MDYIQIESLKWKPISKNDLSHIVNNPDLKKYLLNISENMDFSTTKKYIYFKRRDGRVIAQPKDGSAAFCVDCNNKLKYRSPAYYAEIEDFDSPMKVLIPYCTNEDHYIT